MIFRIESVEATFALDDKTNLLCVAKTIEQAKKMAEEHAGKSLVLVAWKIVFGAKDRGSIYVVNKPCFATKNTEKKCRVPVRKQEN